METLVSLKKEGWLSWFLRGLIFLGSLLLFTRLLELQVIKGNYFASLSDGNRIRRVPIVAPRGKILARGGELLVGNRDVKKKIIFGASTGFKKVDLEGQDANLEDTLVEPERYYPLGSKFAHVSGYVGYVNEDELGKINPRCPEKDARKAGDIIGRAGLEEEYDCILRGVDGEELIEVDTFGKKIRVLGKKDPIPGADIKTFIDFDLQQKLPEFIADKKGAIVVLDPQGSVLALYSSPSFDPNIFIKKDNVSDVEQILKNPDLPLFNRAIGGQFHPGSVFKPVVALAALSEGAITKDYIFDDPGVINIGKFSYANWYFTQYGMTEGRIGLTRAIARSTDTFFYKLGESLGISKIVDWAKRFGFGKETGIDIPGEITALVPTPEWKLDVKKEPWFLGNTYHVSIGQGDLTATPIQVAVETSVIANGGELCSPKIGGDLGQREKTCQEIGIKSQDLDLVKQGMVNACSVGGTGYTFFDFDQKVACKTGTAETNEDGKTHAWFTVFGPADFPDIIATVLLERGGEGSKVAGPIARQIFDYWFGREK